MTAHKEERIRHAEGSPAQSAVRRRGLIAGAAALVASAALLRQSQSVKADTNVPIGYVAADPFSPNPGYVFEGDASQLPDGYNIDGVLGFGKGNRRGVVGFGGNNSGIGAHGIGGAPNGVGVRGDGTGTGAGIIGNGGASNGVGVGGYGSGSGAGVLGTGGGSGPGVLGTGGGSEPGVLGNGGGSGPGVIGNGSGDATGVIGNAVANGVGVAGFGSGSGAGVLGTGGAGGGGVKGVSTNNVTSDFGSGVYGINTSGSLAVGVYGNAANGYGVYGNTGPGGYGVTGVSPDTYGVVGVSTSGKGVYGASTSGTGIYGIIPSGSASGTLAIAGTNNSSAANSHGIVGTAGSGHGLIGNTNFTGGGPPFYGGLVGNAPNGAYAGLFFGKVAITGTLNGHTAIMQQAQVAVAHPDGTHRLTQAVVSPEGWMEDVGKGTLANGQAAVKIDPAFAALADTSDYHVFLTAYGDYHLHVPEMKAEGFSVRVSSAGSGTLPTGGAPVPGSQVAKASGVAGTFSWKVMAKRKDGQADRLAAYTFPKVEAPTIPPPEPSKK